MASILHNDHLITSCAVFDEAAQTWTVQVQITVNEKERSFRTKEEAETYGFNLAQRLVDSGCHWVSNWPMGCAARSVVAVRRPGIGCDRDCAGNAVVDDRRRLKRRSNSPLSNPTARFRTAVR